MMYSLLTIIDSPDVYQSVSGQKVDGQKVDGQNVDGQKVDGQKVDGQKVDTCTGDKRSIYLNID